MAEVIVCTPLRGSPSVSYIRSRYYVYALFKRGEVNPFYVGKGINNRINQHFMESSLKRENNRKSNTIRKHYDTIRREILCYFDTEEAAFDFEEYLINYYKLVEDGGCLFNIAKSRHEFPLESREIVSKKKIERTIVYPEEEVLALYRNYFEKRKTKRESVEGTTIPRGYASAIVRGERFKGLYDKYITSGIVKNLRKEEDDFIRKGPENQKVSDDELREIFNLVCSGEATLAEICLPRGYSPSWVGRVFAGKDRRYLNLDYDLYKSLPKGKHVSMERTYQEFVKHYSASVTDVDTLIRLVGRSEATIRRYIRRYKKEKEASNGS